MPTPYVALLRGINVGGKNVIRMEALRATFERLGFKNVATLIASGNVVFTASGDAVALEKKIEKALAADFRYEAKVVVRGLKDYEKMMKAFPPKWGTDPACRHYVLFLRQNVDRKAVLKGIPVNAEMEDVLYVPGALLWQARIDKLGRSKAKNLMVMPIYKDMTIRNINTARKLHAMLRALAAG